MRQLRTRIRSRCLPAVAGMWLALAGLATAEPLAPDEIDPEAAAASQEDLFDPAVPDQPAMEAAASQAPRSLAPQQIDDPTVQPLNPSGPDINSPQTSQQTSRPRPSAKPAPAADGAALLRKAFVKSKTAFGEEGFSEIIDMCQQAFSAGVQGPNLVYARQLRAWAHNRRGEVRADLGHDKDAFDDFAMAVKLDSSKWRYYHNRGVSLAVLGQYDGAIADFDQTLKLNPRYANAYFNRGELRYEKGDFSGALQDYTSSLKLNPKDPAAFNSRGHTYYRMQRYHEAIADFNQSVRLDPRGAAALTNRGDLEADLGKYADAAHDYRSAIQLNPKLGRAYQSAAWLMATCPKEEFRNAELAMEAAQKAIALDGEDHRYLETLAAAQANVGDFDGAVVTQNKVLELVPKELKTRAEELLLLYRKQSPYRELPREAPAAVQAVPARSPQSAAVRVAPIRNH